MCYGPPTWLVSLSQAGSLSLNKRETKACGPAKPLDDREAIPENRGRVETGKSLLRPKTRRFSRPLKSDALV